MDLSKLGDLFPARDGGQGRYDGGSSIVSKEPNRTIGKGETPAAPRVHTPQLVHGIYIVHVIGRSENIRGPTDYKN